MFYVALIIVLSPFLPAVFEFLLAACYTIYMVAANLVLYKTKGQRGNIKKR